jgi:hypothetical protein
MDSQTTIQVICGVLAVVCVAVIVIRRKGKKAKEDASDF